MKLNARYIIFIAAIFLTVLLPLIWEVVQQTWIAIAFLIIAECMLFLEPARWKDESFPLRLPLLLFVYPLYFVATLTLVFVSTLMSWKLLLTIELVLTFLLLMAICICKLTLKDGENK